MSDIVQRLLGHDRRTGGDGRSIYAEAADKIKQLRTALRNVRAYIADCDHEPALDEIDAALEPSSPVTPRARGMVMAVITAQCIACKSKRDIPEDEAERLANAMSVPMCEICGMPMDVRGARLGCGKE